jgi:hypothetical protein
VEISWVVIGRAGWDFEQETPAKNSTMEPRVEDWFKKHFKLKKKIERKSIYSPRQTPPKQEKSIFHKRNPKIAPKIAPKKTAKTRQTLENLQNENHIRGECGQN